MNDLEEPTGIPLIESDTEQAHVEYTGKSSLKRADMQQPSGITGTIATTSHLLDAKTRNLSQPNSIGSAATISHDVLLFDAGGRALLRGKTQDASMSVETINTSHRATGDEDYRRKASPSESARPQTVNQAKGRRSFTFGRRTQRLERSRTGPSSPLATASAELSTRWALDLGKRSSGSRTEPRSQPSSMQKLSVSDPRLSRSPSFCDWLGVAPQGRMLSTKMSDDPIRQAGESGNRQTLSVSQGQSSATSQTLPAEFGRRQRIGRTRSSCFPLTASLPPRLRPTTRLAAGKLAGPSGSEIRMINLGIETEFYLATRGADPSQGNLFNFAKILAANFNAEAADHGLRMRSTMRPYDYKGDYDKWCLVCDDTIATPSSPCKSFPHGLVSRPDYSWLTKLLRGIELVSPILMAFPGSSWRDDVYSIWNFLQREYNILGSRLCATHIHISLEPDYSLTDIKRLAQAIIHFEPAFEALVPPDRRGNHYARSNWLDGPRLGRLGLSRQDSVAAIEQVLSLDHLMELFQPIHGIDRDFAWNFYSLFTKTKTIEFRKPPLSLTPDEVLCWAELALSFVQAAIRCKPSELQKVPSTIGGLRWFLHQFHVPGMSEPDRLQSLWRWKDPEAALEPKPQAQKQYAKRPDLRAKLHKTVAEDERQIRNFAKKAQEPYW